MESMGKRKARPRRSFTPEFKAEIVELCRRGDRSVGQVAKDFDRTESKGSRVVAGRLRADRWENPDGEKRSRMVLDADEVGASLTFATVTITRTSRVLPPRETAPDDPWASASPVRPTTPESSAGGEVPCQEPPVPGEEPEPERWLCGVVVFSSAGRALPPERFTGRARPVDRPVGPLAIDSGPTVDRPYQG
ncbi:hypothetical protein [Streptomyces sp. NPDC051909]|uniref:hypothetical protein n=1 Tax=Streptomyces sp. NPDC051909 TaxID=3154944 RepID=UPI003444666A